LVLTIHLKEGEFEMILLHLGVQLIRDLRTKKNISELLQTFCIKQKQRNYCRGSEAVAT